MQPIEEPAPAETPFDWIGGEAQVRTLVDRFYDLMEQEPAYAELRAIHADDLTDMRAQLPLFLAGLVIQRSRDLILRQQPFAQFVLGVSASAAVPLLLTTRLGPAITAGFETPFSPGSGL